MNCSMCPLNGCKRVEPEGNPATCKYVLIGEAPGADEVRLGRPFVGRSGRTLDKLLAATGLPREDCYLTNAVKCRPPNNKLPKPAIALCRPFLLDELRRVPKDVPWCVMGGNAREALFPGDKGGVLANRGWRDFYGRDVLCTVHPAYIMYNPANAPLLLTDFRRLQSGRQPPIGVEHIVIDTPDLLRRLITEVGKYEGQFVACDLETNQVDYMRDEILCIGIGYAPGRAAMITKELLYGEGFPPRPPLEVKDLLQDLFDLPVRWVGHNARFDWRFLEHQLGLTVRWDFDTLLAHYVLDERRGTHGLKGLADEYFDTGSYEDEVHAYVGKASGDYRAVPPDVLHKYCALDVEITRRLALIFEKALKEQGLYEKPFRFPVMAAMPVLHSMEMVGLEIDWDELERVDEEEIVPELARLKAELQEISGRPDLNPLSSQKINNIVYDELGFPVIAVRQRAAGKRVKARSTQVAVLDGFAKMWKEGTLPVTEEAWHFIEVLREYRHIRKIQGSYVRKWLKFRGTDDRVHPSFLMYGTVTGRLAATDPPVQTIPSKKREKWGKFISNAHIAAPGCRLVYADYSQMELRVAACLSKDPFMLASFRKPDTDYHSEVALAGWGPDFTQANRTDAKRMTFGWLFGGNVAEIASQALQLQGAMAQAFADRWNTTFKKVIAWRKERGAEMRTKGFVESLFGRRRRFAMLTKENLGKALRIAANMPIQSAASDFTLTSAIRMHDLYKETDYARVVLLIHDALIMEVREDKCEEVGEAMSRTMIEVVAEHLPDIPFKADVKIIDRLGEA